MLAIDQISEKKEGILIEVLVDLIEKTGEVIHQEEMTGMIVMGVFKEILIEKIWDQIKVNSLKTIICFYYYNHLM